VTDPRGVVWGNCPRKRLWRPVEFRPFDINAPFLEPIDVETKIKRHYKPQVLKFFQSRQIWR